MTITKQVNGSRMTVFVTGRLDTLTAPELEAEINASLDGINDLIMDFEKLDYISSAGLRLLLNAYNTMRSKGGTLKVLHINEVVRGVFEVTGFLDVLDVE